MAINFDAFLAWAENRFGDVIVKGREIKLNSIFTEDKKHHLWCNTTGGIHNVEDGCYRCFYTDKKGTLVGLVMQVDNCSHEEAKDLLSGETSIGDLEAKLDAFFQGKEDTPPPETKENRISLPKEATPVTANSKAVAYLAARKLPVEGLYFCEKGDYKNRILIPYFNNEGKLIYFNCRSLSNKGLRYLGPDKKIGVGKGEVIFAKHWPKPGTRIYLTEGEFDAITLSLCGFNGMACGGKYISEDQIGILRDYKICLALDEDSSGFSAIIEMGKKLVLNGIEDNITFVRPPKGLKDWNKMLVAFKAEMIQTWIQQHEKRFDSWADTSLNFINL